MTLLAPRAHEVAPEIEFTAAGVEAGCTGVEEVLDIVSVEGGVAITGGMGEGFADVEVETPDVRLEGGGELWLLVVVVDCGLACGGVEENVRWGADSVLGAAGAGSGA